MNILLIIHPLAQLPVAYYNIPMGMLYVASHVRKAGHQVSILNLNEFPADQHERIIAYRVKEADTVMLGGLSVHFNGIRTIIRMVRKHAPGVYIVLGGGIVTSQSEIVKDLLPEVDNFIVGEVESINIMFLIFGAGILNTKQKVSVSVLDHAFPAYDLFDMEFYLGIQRPSDGHYRSIVSRPREGAVIASRGCPYKCTFCFHPTGDVYRQRSLDSVFEEIDTLVGNYGINILTVYDELFAISRGRLADFCERIKKYGIYWSCQLRVDSVDEDSLRMMKDSGCYILSLGIESGNDTILRSYEKHITVAQIDKALELTKKVGVAVQGNILIGAEAETLDTVKESLAWREKHKEYLLAVTPVVPYPGTEMYTNAVRKGIIDPVKFIEDSCPAVNCSGMNADDIAAVQKMMADVMSDIPKTRIVNICTDTIDAYGRVQVGFNLVCPHCGYDDRRENYALESVTGGVHFCRKCFMRFMVEK